MTYWELYWITRLDPLHCSIVTFSITVFCSATISARIWLKNADMDYEPNRVIAKTAFLWCKRFLFLSVLSGLISTLIPNTKDLALIYSGHFATHSEEMKKLPDNLLRYLNTFLEEKKESK